MSENRPGLFQRFFGGGAGASIQSEDDGVQGQGVTRTLALTNEYQRVPEITGDTAYMLQNRSPYKCYFDIGPSEPSNDKTAFVIDTNSFIIMRPEGSERIYARGATSGGYLVYTKHWQQ